MTKKILLMFAFIATMISSASAFTIILQGGGIRHEYNYVRLTSYRCECRGTGHNKCPITFSGTASERTIKYEDVVNEVQMRIGKGELKGNMLFAEVMPVEWYTTDKDELVITTKEDAVNLPK